MKRLFWLTAFSIFVSCSMREEYTPPSPIELKPRRTKSLAYQQQETPADKFGDEGLEPVDVEEKVEDFDPRLERQVRIQEGIATAERKKRAGKLTVPEKKNIKIERKTAGDLTKSKEHKSVETPKPVAEKNKAAEKQPQSVITQAKTPKEPVDDLDLDDLDD